MALDEQTDIYSVSGRVFDLQRFSVHDGPGIRTIVFLKGCALRCRWCCNPESQSAMTQTLVMNGQPKEVGRTVTVGELIPELRKDAPYYRRSGGGITLSGGETLCQPDFAEALFRACHENGFNTCIETTGFARPEIVMQVLPHIDTVLMDIKHINSEKHKEFTSQPNEWILSNALLIAQNAKHLIIRTPVIPTFNDTDEEIAAIGHFASGLPNVKEWNLLPYHRLGQDKYAGLGRPYAMSHIVPMDKEKVDHILAVAKESSGLRCQIGG